MEPITPPRDGERRYSFLGTLLLVLAGPLIWATHLLVIYGTSTILSAQAAPGRSPGIVIGAATLLALAVLAIVLRGSEVSARGGEGESVHRFLENVKRLLTILSGLGILWAGSTVLFLPTDHP
jgi:hypothetical protein